MKNKYLAFPLFLFLIACGSEESSSSSSEPNNNVAESDELTENQTLEENNTVEEEEFDGEFTASSDVERYDNSKVPEFETYQFKDAFEYVFPEQAEFSVDDEYEAESSMASVVFEGSIYKLHFMDYTESGRVIDDSHLKHICHNSEYEFVGGENVTNESVTNANGLSGYYSTYNYTSGEHYYSEDLVTLQIGDHTAAVFQITSRPNFESKAKLEYFINSVKAL